MIHERRFFSFFGLMPDGHGRKFTPLAPKRRFVSTSDWTDSSSLLLGNIAIRYFKRCFFFNSNIIFGKKNKSRLSIDYSKHISVNSRSHRWLLRGKSHHIKIGKFSVNRLISLFRKIHGILGNSKNAFFQIWSRKIEPPI